MKGEPYHPIQCSVHDVLEAAAVLRRVCRCRFREPDGTIREIDSVIVDVFARGGAEYVQLEGEKLVRLDYLELVEPLDDRASG